MADVMDRVDEAVAPLVAQLDAIAGHMAHHRLPLDDCDPVACRCGGADCGLTVGDLRGVVGLVRDHASELVELRAVVARLRTRISSLQAERMSCWPGRDGLARVATEEEIRG